MTELAHALGEDGPGISPTARAVGQGAEHDHGVTVIRHDEMKPIEREIWSYQRMVNLYTAPAEWSAWATGLFRGGCGRMSDRGKDAPASPPGAASGGEPKGSRFVLNYTPRDVPSGPRWQIVYYDGGDGRARRR